MFLWVFQGNCIKRPEGRVAAEGKTRFPLARILNTVCMPYFRFYRAQDQ